METRFNPDLAEELASMVDHLQRLLILHLTTEVEREKLSLVQYTALSLIDKESGGTGVNMTRIAKEMGSSAPTMAGIVQRLFVAGMVERFAHPSDRRQVLIRVSEKGRAFLEKLKRSMVRNIQDVFTELAPSDVEAWVRVYRTRQAKALSRKES